MATGISDWRRECEMVLPSGNVARLRKIHVLDLAEQGHIPAPLAGMVAALTSSGRAVIHAEQFKEYAELIHLVVKTAFVEPALADQADEAHLAVGDVDMADQLEVFNWCHEGKKLQPFRAKQAGAVGTAQPGGGLRPATERDSGDRE
jgi:hypothetical protein